MNVITLPQDLDLSEDLPIQLHYYLSDSSCTRSKITLSKNTFSFLLEGQKEVIADNHSTTIQNNDFLLMRSGNCLMTETISPNRQTYRSMLLFFSDDVLFNFLEQHSKPLSSKNNAVFFQVVAYDQYIRQFVQSLHTLHNLDKTTQQELLAVKINEILLYLLHTQGAAFLHALAAYKDNRMARLSSVVEHHKFNRLNLQELAFLSQMSLSTFKRVFKEQYQTSPIKWFQERRLEHAAFLLRNQHKRPIDIYDEVGYESLSTFVQAFRNKFGTTPKQFQLNTMNF